ncbi:uncharacterized protein LOC127838328 [Dreissena polymorpha]|nr:uncharacterized protein LOC127838328 [Dreissena polymorpha]
MTTCPTFTTVTTDTQFITVDNVAQLIPSTDARTVGTTVTVTCSSGLVLKGPSTFQCLNGGKWSYETKPECVVAGATTPAPPADNTSKIVIGVVAGLGGVITLALIIMIIFIYRKDRQRRAEKRDLLVNFDKTPRRDYSPSGPSTIEMSESHPYRDDYKRGDPNRAGKQFGRPVYLPPLSRGEGARYPDDYPPSYSQGAGARHQDDYHRADYPPVDYNRRPVDWRKAVLEDRDLPRRQDGYTGRWISRHSNRDPEEHLDRAHIHGGYNPQEILSYGEMRPNIETCGSGQR